MPDAPHGELKNPGYEIFIAIVSMLTMVNLVLVYVASDPGIQGVLTAMNWLLSGVLLIDFLYRFGTAASRSGYFFRGFGWADLLSTLPIAELKFLRIFRLVRVYRLMQDLGGRSVVRSLLRERAGSALLSLLLMGILVMEFGSLQILYFEKDAPGANIIDASDALWYTIVTISTVGYGDQFPVTNGGRVMGAFIIVVGVGIFGTFTGYLANLFLAPRTPEVEADSTARRPSALRVRVHLSGPLVVQRPAQHHGTRDQDARDLVDDVVLAEVAERQRPWRPGRGAAASARVSAAG